MRFGFLIVAGLAIISPGSAYAHAQLVNATPAVGSVIHAVPTDVAINYTEGVEPAFSTLEVRDASGARVDTGAVHTADGDNKQMVVGLKPLKPGKYEVVWHVVSVDTHKTQGSFAFTLSP